MLIVTLTLAQRSALECAGLELCDPREPEDQDLLVLAAAWDGRNRLTVTDASRDALFSALTDRSNAEDARAQEDTDLTMRKFARGAALALSNLSSKVLRMVF